MQDKLMCFIDTDSYILEELVEMQAFCIDYLEIGLLDIFLNSSVGVLLVCMISVIFFYLADILFFNLKVLLKLCELYS